MIFKKSFSLLIVIVFILTSVLAQFSWAAEASQATLLEDLHQIEVSIYGVTQDKPLVERVEYLEKELVGRTLPGTIIDRVKQLKEFIITGTPEDVSVMFKINSSQWVLEEKITNENLITKINNLENVLFGNTSEDVLAMRAETIFNICFKEGKPVTEEVTIPSGTLIPIRFQNAISSKDAMPGDTFTYQVVKNMFIGNKLLIPMNSKGIGEITEAKKAKMLAQPGKLELIFNPIMALDGTPIELIMGEKAEEENKRLYVAVGTGILGFLVLSNPIGLAFGALIPGKDVKIDEGTEMVLQVKEDSKVLALVP
jgi:hypothetical protein